MGHMNLFLILYMYAVERMKAIALFQIAISELQLRLIGNCPVRSLKLESQKNHGLCEG